jgi:hypothetical protein
VSDVIGSLFGCDERFNENGTFSESGVHKTFLTTWLLNHKASEIEMQICCFKFEAMEFKRYRFKLTDCAAIVDELDAVNWCILFRVEGSTNAWTNSTRRSEARLAFFPTGGRFSYVTPIFKKGRRNNFEDYRGEAILSAIPKHFELLVYRGMYNDL